MSRKLAAQCSALCISGGGGECKCIGACAEECGSKKGGDCHGLCSGLCEKRTPAEYAAHLTERAKQDGIPDEAVLSMVMDAVHKVLPKHKAERLLSEALKCASA